MEADGKRALICGVSGQDGAYLARLLLGNGYTVPLFRAAEEGCAEGAGWSV